MKTLKPTEYATLPDGTVVLWISGSDRIWGDDNGPLTFASKEVAQAFMDTNGLAYPTQPATIASLEFLP